MSKGKGQNNVQFLDFLEMGVVRNQRGIREGSERERRGNGEVMVKELIDRYL